MSEEVFCPDCDKELIKEKGEYDHGCLDCHGTIQSEKLFWYRKEITRLKKALGIANEAIGFYEQASRIEGDSDEEMVTTLVSYTGINRRNSGAGTIQSSHKKYGKRAREAQKQIKEVMESK